MKFYDQDFGGDRTFQLLHPKKREAKNIFLFSKIRSFEI